MDSSFVWQSLAQGGVAIIVLSLVANQLWKRFQSNIDKQESENAALRAAIQEVQKQKDDLHRELNKRIQNLTDNHMLFVRESLSKYESLVAQQRESIDHNTEALNSLQTLIKQKT